MAGHIKYGRSVESTISTSHDDWYGVAAQVGTHTNKRSRRTDITCVLSPEAGMGAPACFIPSLAELHINTDMVPMGPVEKVDLTDRMWMLTYAPAVGAMDHEAAHARHTKFDPRELMEVYGATRKMVDVITTLEEPRIEANSVRWSPDTRTFLRGCAMEIVGKDFHIPDSKYGAAAAAGLLLARVDAKVLTKGETKDFRKAIRKVLGTDLLNALEPLWKRFLSLRDNDYEGMVDVAREWLELLEEDPEDSSGMVAVMLIGEPLPGDEEGEGGEGEGSGSGEGDEEGEGSEGEGAASGFGGIIMAKVHETETKMDTEVTEARGAERADRRRKEREADAERGKEGDREHAKAFGKAAKGLHGYTPGGFAHLTGTREPTSDERRAARLLAAQLERIDYRDRAVVKTTSVLPPGRLRGRAAVQAEAYAEQGRDASEVPMWAGKRRRKVESTPLTIGFAVDISGSMSAAMEPLASTQWVVSNAGAHIDAKVATAHFGERVYGVTPAGVREKDVRIFYPGDGSEAFRAAALALDRELNLLDGTGARILFVASDGVFVVDGEPEYAATFMRLAERKGVSVVFLDFTRSMSYGSYGAPVIDCYGKKPAEVATLCGKAAIESLRRLDARV